MKIFHFLKAVPFLLQVLALIPDWNWQEDFGVLDGSVVSSASLHGDFPSASKDLKETPSTAGPELLLGENAANASWGSFST